MINPQLSFLGCNNFGLMFWMMMQNFVKQGCIWMGSKIIIFIGIQIRSYIFRKKMCWEWWQWIWTIREWWKILEMWCNIIVFIVTEVVMWENLLLCSGDRDVGDENNSSTFLFLLSFFTDNSSSVFSVGVGDEIVSIDGFICAWKCKQ